jgi:hypothetical protein
MASIRNYNAFLRAVKAEHGLTHRQAQQAAKAMREHIGRPVKGVDVERHPRLTKRFSDKAVRSRPPAARPPGRVEREPVGAGAASVGIPAVIRDLPQYESLFDDEFFDFDVDYESTAEYKEA